MYSRTYFNESHEYDELTLQHRYDHALRSLVPTSRIDITKETDVSNVLLKSMNDADFNMQIYDSREAIEEAFDRVFEQFLQAENVSSSSTIDIREEELQQDQENSDEAYVMTLRSIVEKWQRSSSKSLRFPSTLTSKHRFLVHDAVKNMSGVSSKSFNTGKKKRQVLVSRDPDQVVKKCLYSEAFQSIYASAMIRWSHDPCRVERLMRESGFKVLDERMLYAYLRCHADAGDSESALKLLSSVSPDILTLDHYNVAISACEKDGRVDDALELLKQASLTERSPQSIRKCWNAALAVAEHAEDWDSVETLMVSWPSRYRSVRHDRPGGPFALSVQRNQKKIERANQNPARTLR